MPTNPTPVKSKPGAPAPQAPPPRGSRGATPAAPPQQGQNPESPTPTAAVQPPPVLKEGDDCPDSTLAVKGLTNAPQYFIGDQPKFTMVVTNIGLVSCKRDVGAAVLAAYVYSLDNKRLWSNLDCAPSNETLVKTFTPGEQVTTAVTWTGMGSAPHCPLPRPAIGPGTYNLVVQLGNLRSQPVPFILNQPPPPPGPVPGRVSRRSRRRRRRRRRLRLPRAELRARLAPLSSVGRRSSTPPAAIAPPARGGPTSRRCRPPIAGR